MNERRFREVQAIMRAPFPPICAAREFSRSYRWAGVHIDRPIPIEGQRVGKASTADYDPESQGSRKVWYSDRENWMLYDQLIQLETEDE